MPLLKRHQHTSKAVRILTQPFPAPSICNETVQVPSSGKVGVRFRWNGKPGDRVKIVAIDDDSPLANTSIRVGHSVLAVNGVPALKSSQVGRLIRSSGHQVMLTTCESGFVAQAPFCKVLTAPGGKRHPGINLDSTRDRCLVRITRVFPNGPFMGTDLQEGDILLAVNGVAVSKPEEADRLLQDASIHSAYCHLYVLDIRSYRESIVEEIQAAVRNYEGLALKDDLDGSSRQHYLLNDSVTNTSFPIQFSQETQRVLNTPGLTSIQSRGFQGKRSYKDLIVPFIKAYNDGMEKRMRVLEEAISCEVWKVSCEKAEQKWKTESCASSDEEVSLAWSGGSGDSTPQLVDTVQVAAAELIVFPLEALQTLDERANHRALLTTI